MIEKPAPEMGGKEGLPKVHKKLIRNFVGLNLDELSDVQRDNVATFLNEEICPCNCPKTFAQCLAIENGCKPGLLLARWTVEQIKKGIPETHLFKFISEEINAGFLAAPLDIDTKGAHQKGDEKAPIVIVEFADFECPACKIAAAEMKKFIAAHKDVQLYFMHFPLPAHKHAQNAAVATEAAGMVGKPWFWEMHDRLFAQNGPLTDEVIKNIAGEIFTDPKQLAQFEKNLSNPALLEKVNAQRSYGQNKVNLGGTPTFFVNGRPYNLTSNVEGFELRLAMEKARNDSKCHAGE